MLISIFFVALIGFFLSLYSFFVERNLEKDQSYQPLCDISDRISCSKPFKSPYGKLIIFSNTIWGMLFYSIIALCAVFELKAPIFFLSILSVSLSLFLAYILYTKVKSLCLICISIYGINFLLLLLSYYAWMYSGEL